MPDAGTLKAAADAGGWVFATASIALGAGFIIRWLVGLVDRQTAAIERLTTAVGALTDEVRASRRR